MSALPSLSLEFSKAADLESVQAFLARQRENDQNLKKLLHTRKPEALGAAVSAGNALLLKDKDGDIKGFAATYNHTSGFTEIGTVLCAPEIRGFGAADLLVSTLHASAQQQNPDNIIVAHVFDHNNAGKAFFTGLCWERYNSLPELQALNQSQGLLFIFPIEWYTPSEHSQDIHDTFLQRLEHAPTTLLNKNNDELKITIDPNIVSALQMGAAMA